MVRIIDAQMQSEAGYHTAWVIAAEPEIAFDR
jgi:hypothetical protein